MSSKLLNKDEIIDDIIFLMGNINAPDIKYFESFADEIESKFQRIKILTEHKATSGDYHEEILRTIIRNFLTKRYSVKKGFIYNGKNEVSNQLDIMIIDESSPAAYLFQEGDFAIVIPEPVIAVLEVKTTLNAPDFDKSINNIASAKRLTKYHTNPLGIVFGYSGTKPSDKILDSWYRRSIPSAIKDNFVLGPNAIMFFEEGCLLTRHKEDGGWNYNGKYYHKSFRSNEQPDIGWQLSIVLAMILAACEAKEAANRHTFPDKIADRLIQGEGSSISNNRFSFGEKMSILK